MSQNTFPQGPGSQNRPGPQFHEQQNYAGQQPQNYAGQQPPEKKKNWFARHKTLTVIGAIVILIIFFTAVAGGGSDDEPVADAGAPVAEEAPAEDSPAEPAEAEAEPAEQTASIGDAVASGDLEFTVTSTEPGGATIGSEYLSTEAQGEFFLVHVSVTNIGDEAVSFTGGNQSLIDDQGREHETDGAASLYIPDNDTLFTTINPGNTVDGTLVFDIPADAVPTTINVKGSIFGDAVAISISGA